MNLRSCDKNCKTPTGSEESHCTKCHKNFWTVSSFDLHRYDPDLREDLDNDCWEPESIGLILKDNLWDTPENHNLRDSIVKRLDAARASRYKKR